MDKRLIAVTACASLIGCELLREMETFDLRHAVADAPHNHVEMAEGTFIEVSSPFSASGGQSERERYYLYIVPVYTTTSEGNQQVLGYDAYGIPDYGTQRMYKRFETLDGLLSTLQSERGLQQPQLEATRQSLLHGTPTEIGGHRARLLLPEESMRSLGLVFGYPES